jgi:hypothetical protein
VKYEQPRFEDDESKVDEQSARMTETSTDNDTVVPDQHIARRQTPSVRRAELKEMSYEAQVGMLNAAWVGIKQQVTYLEGRKVKFQEAVEASTGVEGVYLPEFAITADEVGTFLVEQGERFGNGWMPSEDDAKGGKYAPQRLGVVTDLTVRALDSGLPGRYDNFLTQIAHYVELITQVADLGNKLRQVSSDILNSK